MSLVPVWVRAIDGKYYEEAVVHGRDSCGRWYLVFDDEDPPELVVERGGHLVTYARVASIFNSINLKYDIVSRIDLCERLFGKKYDKFRSAGAVFVKIDGPIPVPSEHERVADSLETIPGGEKVVYAFQEKL